MSVLIETTIGDITIDLLTKERPRACLNFLKLCKTKYYNYCIFFNVQRDFIAQTGDPFGTGKGGESVFSKLYGEQAAFFEPETQPIIRHSRIGTVSFANNGQNMHGSQFFLTLGDNLDYLDGVHTVFGEIAEGVELLQKLNEAIVDDSNRPYQDIRINHTVILDDPFPDPAGLDVPERSPSPTADQLETGRIAPGESTEEHEGLSKGEVEELIQEKEAKARAQILEMVGDLPDAEVKPPDNVLFVCKLNPVTSDDDLFIIFSRFGPIKSCEVIRDQKSGDSLQYAFIEFEEEDHCASAYFKMDNVLIDDRRIHVDFSQSVSKLEWMDRMKKQTRGSSKIPRSRSDRDEEAGTGKKDRNLATKKDTHEENQISRKDHQENHRRSDYRGKRSRSRSRSGSISNGRHKERRKPESRHHQSSSRKQHPEPDRSRSRSASSDRRSSKKHRRKDVKSQERRRHSRERSRSPVSYRRRNR